MNDNGPLRIHLEGVDLRELPPWIKVNGQLYRRVVHFGPEHQKMMGVHEIFDDETAPPQEDLEPDGSQ